MPTQTRFIAPNLLRYGRLSLTFAVAAALLTSRLHAKEAAAPSDIHPQKSSSPVQEQAARWSLFYSEDSYHSSEYEVGYTNQKKIRISLAYRNGQDPLAQQRTSLVAKKLFFQDNLFVGTQLAYTRMHNRSRDFNQYVGVLEKEVAAGENRAELREGSLHLLLGTEITPFAGPLKIGVNLAESRHSLAKSKEKYSYPADTDGKQQQDYRDFIAFHQPKKSAWHWLSKIYIGFTF
jgi:hypothetical protein